MVYTGSVRQFAQSAVSKCCQRLMRLSVCRGVRVPVIMSSLEQMAAEQQVAVKLSTANSEAKPQVLWTVILYVRLQ